jgi:hypothetical protein
VPRVKLAEFAFARSGDKGSSSNVGVWTATDLGYAVLARELTTTRVAEHFRGIARGEVQRYELPKLRALNFILHDSLDGGGSGTTRTDAQGKAHGNAMLLLEIELSDEEWAGVRRTPDTRQE